MIGALLFLVSSYSSSSDFDGVCLLCAGFVHFVLDHDHEASLDFAPLQGRTGASLLQAAGMPLDVSTVVLIDEEGVHVRSACYKCLRHGLLDLPEKGAPAISAC